ncbi:MAG: DnaA regulatory inactivator Hda [Chromatiaceae bacterium]|jgi:DnaA family protein|nr:DnaA regulatory inactivator Hda [Chromatiaceae bacterium]
MHQLPLAVQLKPEADFAAYVAGPNAEPLAAVTTWAAGEGDDFLYLFGVAGSGKTHLLQAACRQATQSNHSAIYLPLEHGELAPSVLDNLELWDLVALDDIQAIAGDHTWEHGLFDLFNRLRESQRRLLVSAQVPVSGLSLTLADLRSRLSSGPGYRLLPLPEGDCERLLRESAKRRGLDLASDAVDYIMRRCPREPGYLMDLLEEIDRESLRTKRRPTLWLVRQVLKARESLPG